MTIPAGLEGTASMLGTWAVLAGGVLAVTLLANLWPVRRHGDGNGDTVPSTIQDRTLEPTAEKGGEEAGEGLVPPDSSHESGGQWRTLFEDGVYEQTPAGATATKASTPLKPL